MLKFEWNALRRGDVVVLHDPASSESALLSGVVAFVDAPAMRGGANAVGIRVESGDAPRVVWPPFREVHLAADDVVETCWRCAAISAKRTATPRAST